MICPTCGYQNLPKDKFCKQCGMRLPQVKSSKLPLVIILSFLIFTALGTGIAYHFGVINNDPKYVKYDKLQLTDITGKWKIDDGEGINKFPKYITITPSEVKYEDDGENYSFKVDKRIILEPGKLVMFSNKDESEHIVVALNKDKLNNVERVTLYVAGQDDAWGLYIRERK